MLISFLEEEIDTSLRRHRYECNKVFRGYGNGYLIP